MALSPTDLCRSLEWEALASQLKDKRIFFLDHTGHFSPALPHGLCSLVFPWL